MNDVKKFLSEKKREMPEQYNDNYVNFVENYFELTLSEKQNINKSYNNEKNTFRKQVHKQNNNINNSNLYKNNNYNNGNNIVNEVSPNGGFNHFVINKNYISRNNNNGLFN